ncbi:MAG: hypothetical protein MZV64_43620 [Ignavibacteriales bacterium]|nr:hypothetical protein [Ignavibacteriales bacterium]
MQAEAEHGVGPVVGPGDRRELVVDEPLLLLRADRPVSEWDLVLRHLGARGRQPAVLMIPDGPGTPRMPGSLRCSRRPNGP